MKKLNNKGFSLVELIIVIAIMVILVAVLAPQFTRWVERSRIGTDVQNASEIATAAQVAFAEGHGAFSGSVDASAVGTGNYLSSMTSAPTVRSAQIDSSHGNFNLTVDGTTGEVTVTAGGHAMFPALDPAIEALTHD